MHNMMRRWKQAQPINSCQISAGIMNKVATSNAPNKLNLRSVKQGSVKVWIKRET